MKTDFVIYHNGRAYTQYEKLKEVIGANNANKAFLRAINQKTDKEVYSLRKCGKYEIHIK